MRGAEMLTVAQLARASGATAANAERFLRPLVAAIQWYEVRRVPEFLAQISVESGRLTRLEENLNYTTTARLRTVWPTRFRSDSAAQPFVRNPELLANTVYASRMGNGPPESRDGWRFRGRGLKQLTGRDNYTAYSVASGLPVVTHPDLLLTPRWAADSAGWFWQMNGCDALADDIEALTRRVNGGITGLAERIAQTKVAREALT